MAGTMPPSMVAGGAAQETYDGVRIGPPPDLASLLLHNRIVYLGMPMVSAVTELIVAELLYLNYESPSKPVTLYINSPGTVNAQGQAVGFETEAFAIADCMKYIKPPVQTICVGQAFGAAAMLLAQGEKGKRCCRPVDEVMRDASRTKYLQPDEAVEYGLVDKVLHNVGKAADAPKKPSFMDAL